MSSVVIAWTRLIVDHAIAVGLDPAPVLARLGLGLDDLADREGRIDARLDAEVWGGLAIALGDGHVGVQVSERTVSAASYGLVGYVARASATVAEALAHGRQYQRLIMDDSGCHIHETPRGAVILVRPGERDERPRAVIEAVVANYVSLMRSWTGTAVTPLDVRFQHARPRCAAEIERFFGCPVRYDQPDTALVVARETMTLPLRSADLEVLAYLRDLAATRLGALVARSARREVLDEVRAAVQAELDGEAPSIQRVARRLGVSTRSLQRRLGASASSFRQVVDAIRHERALELLQAGATLDQVSAQLGFSDARAFRRAFRRWTGETPSAVRRGPGAAGASGPSAGVAGPWRSRARN